MFSMSKSGKIKNAMLYIFRIAVDSGGSSKCKRMFRLYTYIFILLVLTYLKHRVVIRIVSKLGSTSTGNWHVSNHFSHAFKVL